MLLYMLSWQVNVITCARVHVTQHTCVCQ